VLYVTATADDAMLLPSQWAHIEQLVNAVVDTCKNVTEEPHCVHVRARIGRVHMERRLHQLMHDDRDYESGPARALTLSMRKLFSMGEKGATAVR
jgi:hypothetical protein